MTWRARSFGRRCCAHAVLIAAALGAQVGVVWAEMIVPVPPAGVVDLTFHGGTAPTDPPIASATAPGPVALDAAGPVWVGVGGYPARMGPFDTDAEIPLGALEIVAPKDAVARFGLFASEDGRLVAPLVVGDSLALPAGQYDLRPDLGTGATRVDIEAGATTRVLLGAVVPSQPLMMPAFLADPQTGDVRATLPGGATTVGVLPGAYGVAVNAQLPRGEVVVTAAETTTVPVLALTFESDLDPPAELSLVGRDLLIRPGETFVLPGLGSGTVRIGPIELFSGPVVGTHRVWRLGDDVWPRRDGLPVRFAETAQPRLVAGGETTIEYALAGFADVSVALGNATQTFAQWEWQQGRGQHTRILDLPDDLPPGDEVTVRLTVVRPDAPVLDGVTETRRVHEPLTAPVRDLAVDQADRTTVNLTWSPPDGPAVATYVAYRDGLRLWAVETQAFQDIGLSAGRSYLYAICPLDDLDQEGPCVETHATTAP